MTRSELKTWSFVLSFLVAFSVSTTRSLGSSGLADDPDDLYRHRDDLSSAKRAADLWAPLARSTFEPAWKLARISYWLGTKLPGADRRSALERGITAAETAARLEPGRPEGHFWLAANMGALAESFGLLQGLKYHGRIKDELERVIAIDADWQDAIAECALGQWYFEVPGWLGGSRTKAKEHLERALTAHPRSKTALSYLADVLIAEGRTTEARGLLQRILQSPLDPEWTPEDTDLQKKAAERLRTLK